MGYSSRENIQIADDLGIVPYIPFKKNATGKSRGAPIDVNLPEEFDINQKDQVKTVSDQHQNRLKEVGDWVIFPRTLEFLANGKYSQDEQGNLHFENKPVPQGIRLEAL